MGHQHETSGGKHFRYMTQILLLGVRWNRDTIFDTSAFNRMPCLVCVIIARPLFGVSLNGTGGNSWDKQNKEHRSLDLTGTASMKNQIFYPTHLYAEWIQIAIIAFPVAIAASIVVLILKRRRNPYEKSIYDQNSVSYYTAWKHV